MASRFVDWRGSRVADWPNPKISTVLAGKTPGILMNIFAAKKDRRKSFQIKSLSFATFRGKKLRERTLHSARGSGARGEASL
jgi:hypothetical protein